MNTSSDLNSTPKTIDQSKYIESLMDFSTPMSTISNCWIPTKNLDEFNEKSPSNQSTILDKVLQKFNEHKINFHHTQNYLNSLDNHLREITIVLNQLQTSLDQNSLLKTTTDQIESRLLQMSTKREQIRTVINNFHQSPTINQTLDDIIQQISPSKLIMKTDPLMSYNELINAIKLSLNQKTNLIEHFHYEQNQIKHRTNDYHLKIQQRQELLLQLVEKTLKQQKINEKYMEIINLNKPQFDHHTEQLIEFNKLNEEYQILQDENRELKQKAKENIKILYTFINQTIE